MKTAADAMLELVATEIQDADAMMEDTGDQQQQLDHNAADGDDDVTHLSGTHVDDVIILSAISVPNWWLFVAC